MRVTIVILVLLLLIGSFFSKNTNSSTKYDYKYDSYEANLIMQGVDRKEAKKITNAARDLDDKWK